jgi:hypothetical protein
VKRARDVRARVLAALPEHALIGAQQALLRPTSRLGQRETLREGLSRALRHERMGLPLPAGVPLLRERRDVDAEAAAAAAAAAAEGGSEEEEEAETLTRRPARPRQFAAAAPPAAPAPTPAPAPPSADPFSGCALAVLAAHAHGHRDAQAGPARTSRTSRTSPKRNKAQPRPLRDVASGGGGVHDASQVHAGLAPPDASRVRRRCRAVRRQREQVTKGAWQPRS